MWRRLIRRSRRWAGLERVEWEARRGLEEQLAHANQQRARAGQGPSEAVRLHSEGIKKAQSADSAGALESFQKSAELSKSEGDIRHWQ